MIAFVFSIDIFRGNKSGLIDFPTFHFFTSHCFHHKLSTDNSDDEMDLDEFLDGPLACSNYSSSGSHSSKYSDTYTLVPIDHGYCLPSQLRIDEYDWAWFYCPHVDVEVQPEIKEYMNSLDIEVLLADLTAQLPVSADCLFLLRVAHTLIKEGINAGLTLKEIASMIARVDEDVPSMLETAIANAEDNAQRAIESRAGRRQTTSPAFLKSLEAAQMALLAENAVQSAQLQELQEQELSQQVGPGVSPVVEADSNQQDGDVGLCLDRDSPDSPSISAPPVLVRQRSVGSPRSNGSSSPPQRIGGGHAGPVAVQRGHEAGQRDRRQHGDQQVGADRAHGRRRQ